MISIEEQITLDLVNALNAIRLAAGHENNLRVERRQRVGNSVDDGVLVLAEGDLTPHDQPSLGRDRWIKRYTITIPVMRSDSGGDAEGRSGAQLRADIVRKLNQDYTRSNLALDTRVISCAAIDDPELSGERIEIEVHFWTTKDNPYEQ